MYHHANCLDDIYLANKAGFRNARDAAPDLPGKPASRNWNQPGSGGKPAFLTTLVSDMLQLVVKITYTQA